MSIGLPAAALALILTWPVLPSAHRAPARPKVTDAAQYYPPRAARKGVEGESRIHCVVNPDGRLIGCVVVSETPERYGFGAASVAVAEHMLQTKPPANADGADAVIETTIKWRLPAGVKHAEPSPAS